jgi:hypothetical protein
MTAFVEMCLADCLAVIWWVAMGIALLRFGAWYSWRARGDVDGVVIPIVCWLLACWSMFYVGFQAFRAALWSVLEWWHL